MSLSPGLALPPAFPDLQFEALKGRIIAKMPQPSEEFSNFAGGHNGVRFRLRACADYSKEFVECVRRAGDAPEPEDRYLQERQLFGFFVSGISALDCFCFLLYFAAAQLQPTKFHSQKLGHIQSINRKYTAEAFTRVFPNESITSTLTKLLNAAEMKEWDEYRNILAHRSAPGRNIYKSFGGSPPDPAADWEIAPQGGFKIDVNLTPPFLVWLIKELAALVGATDQFAHKFFEGAV